ncbi:MAG: hypothetical protein ACFFF4_09495 [Candidatus Thorarchaeota archaeon]
MSKNTEIGVLRQGSVHMSEEVNFKDLILYLAAVALVLFFLLYMPWTAMSAIADANVAGLWLYYFGLVLGVLFPLYYAIGRENMAWIVLGLSLMINSIVMFFDTTGTFLLPAVMILLVGLLFFLGPFLEPRMGNWDMIKNVFHLLRGLFIILAVGLYANWVLDDMIGVDSFNHAMPQFLFMGGGLFIAFGIIIFMYGLLKLLAGFMGDTVGGYFKDLASIFYMLMVLVFLLGITYNIVFYLGNLQFGAMVVSSSIQFFAQMSVIGNSNLVAILLIILYIYGLMKIVEKNKQSM